MTEIVEMVRVPSMGSPCYKIEEDLTATDRLLIGLHSHSYQTRKFVFAVLVSGISTTGFLMLVEAMQVI